MTRCVVTYPNGTTRDVTQAIETIQELVGATVDGIPGPETVARVRAVVQALEYPQPPTVKTGSSELRAIGAVSLGERALQYAIGEAERHTGAVSNARVAEYLSGCVRAGSDGVVRNIGGALAESRKLGTKVPYCASFIGFCEDRASLPGEAVPPWRAGALELMRDAREGRRPGESWLPLSEIATRIPRPGDKVIYENTQATGRGHVEFVLAADATGYRAIGGNEQHGQIVTDRSMLLYNGSKTDGVQRLKLLGFVVRDA